LLLILGAIPAAEFTLYRLRALCKHVTDPLVSAERHFCPGRPGDPWLYPCFRCPPPYHSHANGTVSEWHNFPQLLPADGPAGGVWGGAHDQSQNVVESFVDGAIQSIFCV
jgi:hypothetical protein